MLGGNSLVADDLPNMYGATTPIPKQPGMFSQYSHKVVERFENNDDDLLPVATSTFLAEAHNRHEAKPLTLMSAGLGISSKCPAPYI